MRIWTTMTIEFKKRKVLFLPAFLFLACRPGPLCAESLVLTTYYPAPYGGYVSILTTGRTALAREADFVTIGKDGDLVDKLLVNGNITATNNISAGNVLVKGKPVVTNIECEFPLVCTITDNTLSIKIGIPDCPSTGPASGKGGLLGVAASGPASVSVRYGINPDGSICKITGKQMPRFKCPVKPSISEPDCPQVKPRASTCEGQVQADQTCKWFRVNSGDVVIGTEEYTCSVIQNEEKCAPIK